MRRVLLCILASSLSGVAFADDLLCTGIGWAKGEEFQRTVLFRLDPNSLDVSVDTYNGTATGIAQAKPDLYLGLLDTPTGSYYWFNLHRYTGELYLGQENRESAPLGKGEFLGTCKRAERKF